MSENKKEKENKSKNLGNYMLGIYNYRLFICKIKLIKLGKTMGIGAFGKVK
jgi:hypothetical protein